MTNPPEEPNPRIEQSIHSLIRSNFARDAKRERLEKKKILLLALILVSAWAIFFLLCHQLDSVFTPPEPSHEYHAPARHEIRNEGDPIYAI